MRSIEEQGIWFLPDNPQKEINGQLTFTAEEHPKVYLLGQLQSIDFDNAIPRKLEFDILNGYLVNGKKVTLCNCYQPVEFKTGIQTSTVYAKYLIIGHHFKTLKEIYLNGVSLRYKNLEYWLDLPNLEISDADVQGDSYEEINVKQKPLDDINLGKLYGSSLILHDRPIFLGKLLQIFYADRKIVLEEKKSIVIQPNEEKNKNLEDIVNVIYLFQKLLIFAFGQMTYPYDIKSSIIAPEKKLSIPDHIKSALMEGSIGAEKTIESDLGFEIESFGEEIKVIEEEKEVTVQLQIYFKVGDCENLDAKLDLQRVLFRFKDVKCKFEQLLSSWEEKSKKLEPVIDLYLRSIYIPKRHIHDFFLSLAQAIEAFHSLEHDGIYIDKNVYKKEVRSKLYKAIDSIPDDILKEEYKKKFKEEKIPQLNRFSLRERLEEIIHEYKSCLPDNFFVSPEDKDDFLKKIRRTRNHLTHSSSEPDKNVATGQDLLILTRRLRILLEVCLLKELGLKDVVIKTVIANNRMWR